MDRNVFIFYFNEFFAISKILYNFLWRFIIQLEQMGVRYDQKVKQ